MTRRLAAALLAATALAATAAGCGSDNSSSDTRTVTVANAAGGSDTVPTRVEVIRSSKGGFDPTRVYEHASPGVVTVISAGLPGAGPGGQDTAGLGSGFVVSRDGEIATNAHVVTGGEGAGIREAKEVFVRFPDANEVSAKVVGFDPFADVALLRINPKGLKLHALPLGTTKGLHVGQPVAAIGSPFGEEQSLSVGVVSATDRSIDSLTGFATSGAIQTDAAINHGNSGGPLLDAGGNVLGINSQIRSDSGDGTGVGFAVPVDTVRRSLDELRRDGRVHYGYLGVSTKAVYPQLAAKYGLPAAHGALVQIVSGGGPAAKAGIKPGNRKVRYQEDRWLLGGDLIVSVDGQKIVRDSDLSQALADKNPGDKVTVRLYRGGSARDVQVTLGERPLAVPR